MAGVQWVRQVRLTEYISIVAESWVACFVTSFVGVIGGGTKVMTVGDYVFGSSEDAGEP